MSTIEERLKNTIKATKDVLKDNIEEKNSKKVLEELEKLEQDIEKENKID